MDQQERSDAAPGGASIEERRLALELARLKLERQKASIEVRLKRRELTARKTVAGETKEWKELLANPLTLAIVGGFITLMTTTIAGHFSSSESINAEAAKARQALQTDLIKKFVDNPDPQKVRANLKFLVDVGLVPSYAESLKSFLAKSPDSALPSSFTSGSGALDNVRTDDDAIDLVLRFEGGFVQNPINPDGTTHFGLKVSDLSDYRGKPATLDDLRNLSILEAREVYKKLYLNGSASGLSSIQMKAAYLGLATYVGLARANVLLQTAIGKADGLPIAQDGILGPASVQRANAVASDLLIETLNCEAAKFYEKQTVFKFFSRGILKRLRTFSPVALKGLCPELQEGWSPEAAPASKP